VAALSVVRDDFVRDDLAAGGEISTPEIRMI
jgi:hypothetical protein